MANPYRVVYRLSFPKLAAIVGMGAKIEPVVYDHKLGVAIAIGDITFEGSTDLASTDDLLVCFFNQSDLEIVSKIQKLFDKNTRFPYSLYQIRICTMRGNILREEKVNRLY